MVSIDRYIPHAVVLLAASACKTVSPIRLPDRRTCASVSASPIGSYGHVVYILIPGLGLDVDLARTSQLQETPPAGSRVRR